MQIWAFVSIVIWNVLFSCNNMTSWKWPWYHICPLQHSLNIEYHWKIQILNFTPIGPSNMNFRFWMIIPWNWHWNVSMASQQHMCILYFQETVRRECISSYNLLTLFTSAEKNEIKILCFGKKSKRNYLSFLIDN